MSGVAYNINVELSNSVSAIQEFIEKLKSSAATATTVTEKLKDVGNTSTRIFIKMGADEKALDAQTKLVKTGIDELRETLKKMNDLQAARSLKDDFKKAGEEVEKLEGKTKKAATGTQRALGDLKKVLMPLSVAGAVAGAFSFGKESINAAMQYQATSKSYEVLAGNRSKGKDLAGNLNKLQQDTILGPEVFKAGQTLMGFGITAEKVMPIVKQLGDVSMGDAQRFDSLTLAFSQTQAAGRLMGQDLLQYINAGFNPLQTMSERWQEFGFKAKKSVGELKKEMEKGAISSEMVAKAFDLATSKGGKFANMMDTIGQTSYGKLKVLEGQWENFKIQAGTALMPIAEGLMTAANKTMEWITPTETIADKLRVEKQTVNDLVSSITGLNENNDTRKLLLDKLIKAYPDLFGNLDTENTKNADLLEKLKEINNQYERRIGLAQASSDYDVSKSEVGELEALSTAIQNQISYYKLHPEEQNSMNLFNRNKYLGFGNAMKIATDGYGDASIDNLETYKKAVLNPKLDKARTLRDKAGDKYKKTQATYEFESAIKDAYDLAHDESKLDALFTKKKDKQSFLSMANKISLNGGIYNTDGGGVAFADKLKKMMNPVTAQTLSGEDNKKHKKEKLTTMGSNITGGGPRNVTINIGKLQDQTVIHTTNLQAGAKQSADAIIEMILTTLKSVDGKTMNE
ncbi:tape measure protein [Pinibacter soli]|uniref:Tape measure protein n=1 Tax=Pinibacter soli TaxID=3044211 RepID=A0ABT6R988_9BACT|nr:tape measure protein [Pinibacter soli]MDI3319129.1 tape measure protein [Pinibacter soli]